MSYKSDLEAKINQELAFFYKKWTGRGPKRIKAKILEDMLIIRFQLYKYAIHEKLELTPEGSQLSKIINVEMFHSIRAECEEVLEALVGKKVKGIYFNGENQHDEMVMVVTFDGDIEHQNQEET